MLSENPVPCTYELQHSLYLPLLKKWPVFLQNASVNPIPKIYNLLLVLPISQKDRTTVEQTW